MGSSLATAPLGGGAGADALKGREDDGSSQCVTPVRQSYVSCMLGAAEHFILISRHTSLLGLPCGFVGIGTMTARVMEQWAGSSASLLDHDLAGLATGQGKKRTTALDRPAAQTWQHNSARQRAISPGWVGSEVRDGQLRGFCVVLCRAHFDRGSERRCHFGSSTWPPLNERQ